MGVEIERKFLVNQEIWQQLEKPNGVHYHQGYIPSDDSCTVRVRIAGERGYLTLKGKTKGFSRKEFEYEIPFADAQEMLNEFTRTGTEKIRYHIAIGTHVWEVDEFLGPNKGLFVAEIELRDESEPFAIPAWIGEEVTNDRRYANSNLAVHPFLEW
ncbi:CYTH domain-containing protein [Mucilaginibacter agri]|uniref:CYTH domain-containing protein n=1 Tax=Mucilaginibacter agri TaxID=2695265 RepID=A0A965ZDW5_9SPHI|nr:CYTH domain-containing protein [Mucilaginibacter agri]NCD68443.1 CYTH domain-containing protein [Mucilaginibacter agri]